MADPAPRNPYDRRPPAPSTRRRRPLAVIAFIAHALIVGALMAGGSAYGLYQSWAWMDAAPPERPVRDGELCGECGPVPGTPGLQERQQLQHARARTSHPFSLAAAATCGQIPATRVRSVESELS